MSGLRRQVMLPVPDLGQLRPCASYVMRPLTWALKEVDRDVLNRQSRHTCTGNLGIIKIFKIAPHKQKSVVKNIFGRKMGP